VTDRQTDTPPIAKSRFGIAECDKNAARVHINGNMHIGSSKTHKRTACFYACAGLIDLFLPRHAMHSADCAVVRSVCLSVRHTPIFCRNGYTYPQTFFTIG